MGVIYLYVFLPVHIRRDSKASGGAVTLFNRCHYLQNDYTRRSLIAGVQDGGSTPPSSTIFNKPNLSENEVR